MNDTEMNMTEIDNDVEKDESEAVQPKKATKQKANKKNKAADIEAEHALPEKEKFIPKDIDQNQTVIVRNGFQGKLVYISPRTNERFVWDEFGDEQEIELRELRSAKSSAKKFFINNWFMFNAEDEWVVSYLGLNQYYKHAIKIDDFDDIFSKSPDEIEEIISKLSKGQKNSVAYKARQMVVDEEIDSRKMIAALERALNIELIER